GPLSLSLYSVCHSSLKINKLLPLSLANKLFLGPVPDELKDLTVIEEAMSARCRSKFSRRRDLVLPTTQHGIKGHIKASRITHILPPSVEEITSPVYLLFVGSCPPTPEW
ncbi:hypothetical protein B0H13DRAFT_1568643, partial [Mycena leptocephala]